MNMRSLIYSVLMSFQFACLASAGSKNESDIHISGVTKIPNDMIRKFDKFGEPMPGTSIVQWCQGSLPSGVDLNKTSLSAKVLKDGVSCIAEDFDGNGYLDFILYQAPPPNDGTWHTRSALIIFFKSGKLVRTQIPAEFELFQFTDRARKNYPKYRNRAGIINHAQGDRGTVSFFDPATGLFEQVPYVYPEEYGSN